MQTIDLSGEWLYKTDGDDTGYKPGFRLPGSACENAVGVKQEEFSELSLETARSLRQRYSYTGALWLSREVDVPKDFDGKHVELFLERVNIASELWLDGVKAGRQIIGLSTPHVYDLSDAITPGRHTLTLRIDNSDLLNIDGMASGYSDDTQSIWLGVIGKIELRAEDIFHIDNIQIFPKEKSVEARVCVTSDCASPHDRRRVALTLTAISPKGEALRSVTYTKTLYNKKQVLHLEYPMEGEIEYWDEFNPSVYTMAAEMVYSGERGNSEIEDITVSDQNKNAVASGYDKKTVTFGMRTIGVRDKEFILNGRPIALRGTLDCAIYPKTGYPPTDLETWLHTMRTVKEYGLNHIRFHAWCPPEAAFTAADMTGVYVLAEMPFWLNTDVCALAAGDDIIHKYYYSQEAVNISRSYGNHPSFIMFSNGNELMGDFEMLETLTTQIKALDNRRLYTMTSNFDHTIAPCEDFLCAFEARGHRIRIQVFHDVISEHTRLCYDDAVNASDVPIVSFEVGQYCVYPDVDSVGDYDGNMTPVNFRIIGDEMKRHGVYHKLRDYIRASGKLAALLYKEDIEAALRTRKMGGFQLLGLTDYTGQGTATIGLLDVFWNSKDLIEPSEFREFCSEVVPLMKADRVFTSDETFKADFDLYDYGKEPIKSVEYKFSLFDGDRTVYETVTDKTGVSLPLDFIKKPTMLTAALSVGERVNRWTVFVYPKREAKWNVSVTRGYGAELDSIIENGGRAVVMADTKTLAKPIEGLFKPVFWSPAWFKSQRACGLIIESNHPLFSDFPTRDYADFQWKHPIDSSVGADISELPKDFKPLIEPVPNFFDNTPRSPLFEAKVGNADILFCGFDLSVDDKAVRALGCSIANYVGSDSFKPRQELPKSVFKKLFK